jgi:hypothetical protein
MPGDPPDATLVEARRGLLDAMVAISPHLDDAVLVGAQAIYLRTGGAVTGVVLATKDADIALLPPLQESPDIETTMLDAGFQPTAGQPGIWRKGPIQVDLLVPEGLASSKGTRTAHLDGHGSATARKVRGLEAVAVDSGSMTIRSLDVHDSRKVRMLVAGPGALLIAKLVKLAERAAEKSQRRLEAKDAFDIYRLLQLPTLDLAKHVQLALNDSRSAEVAQFALAEGRELFRGPGSTGSRLAGEYLGPVGDPALVAAGSSLLYEDLVRRIQSG